MFFQPSGSADAFCLDGSTLRSHSCCRVDAVEGRVGALGIRCHRHVGEAIVRVRIGAETCDGAFFRQSRHDRCLSGGRVEDGKLRGACS